MKARNKIFVSYSHKDRKLFEEFKTMLAPAIQPGLVDLWDDRKILPGQKWKEEIEKALTSASVAVLLVSQNFLASHFIAEKELPPLLKAAREEGVSIFWIYLSSCLFEQTEIASYQAAHDTSRPLDRLSKSQRQAVLSEICGKLIRTAEQAGPPVEPDSTAQLAKQLFPGREELGELKTTLDKNGIGALTGHTATARSGAMQAPEGEGVPRGPLPEPLGEKEIGEKEIRILKELRDGPRVSRNRHSVAKMTGIEYREVVRLVSKLARMALVASEEVPGKRRRLWFITNKGRGVISTYESQSQVSQ